MAICPVSNPGIGIRTGVRYVTDTCEAGAPSGPESAVATTVTGGPAQEVIFPPPVPPPPLAPSGMIPGVIPPLPRPTPPSDPLPPGPPPGCSVVPLDPVLAATLGAYASSPNAYVQAPDESDAVDELLEVYSAATLAAFSVAISAHA